MKILIATDSFKGSLTSIQAGNAIAKGIEQSGVDAQIDLCPLADGGEGTVDAFAVATNATCHVVRVTGPLGTQTDATYCTFDDVAVVEMAQCAGLDLVGQNKNPLVATTFGVGEVILHAIKNGCKKFVIGIGGSATNDGGIGMLQALGFGFFDKQNNPVPFGANALKHLAKISLTHNPAIDDCTFFVACDVTNPLCGQNGCSFVYAPQKGATPQMTKDMDLWMNDYAHLVERTTGKNFADLPGAGAAGGLGFAFVSFLQATLTPGIDLVAKATNLQQRIDNAHLVITGEGKFDSQTLCGKAPLGVAQLAKKQGKKVIAFCGINTLDENKTKQNGFDKVFATCNGTPSQNDLMTDVAFDKLAKLSQFVFENTDFNF